MENLDQGESSRKGDRNEDERPFKKARYVWEVKGKYHLKQAYKNNNNNNENAEIVNENNNSQENSTGDIHSHRNDACVSAACMNRCCIESFLTKTEAIMDSDDDELSTRNIDQAISSEIPVTLVSPNPKNQDYYIQKWQARQIARGYVDNTINSVLETYRVPRFDATDFVENCDNDGQVEDEGILMAIQSHGLQSNPHGNIQNNVESSNFPTQLASRNQNFAESTLDNIENYHNELIKEGISPSSNNDSMSCDSINQDFDNNSDLAFEDPMDFMNAAVSAAILKKGLSSCSYG